MSTFQELLERLRANGPDNYLEIAIKAMAEQIEANRLAIKELQKAHMQARGIKEVYMGGTKFISEAEYIKRCKEISETLKPKQD